MVKENPFKNSGELHKEWTEAGVTTSRTIGQMDPTHGPRRNRTRLLLSGPKFSFQMDLKSAFHLEIKVQSLEEEWKGQECTVPCFTSAVPSTQRRQRVKRDCNK
ncbi:hypothetical protein CHARACLAT_033421 [Characodon lateralis]|uniref:Uncharacterized protein n=1 Tax=Characodon lateralis TaxID=208331 RepID=A0ABU7E728_9TELE|nr:hypothetical protein [Characodon lateralis]